MKRVDTAILGIGLTICMCIIGVGNACADDTDIYSGGIINVQPNVLIIFDTSGSMGEEVAIGTTPYDPAGTYPGGRPNDRIYYKYGSDWKRLQVNEHCVGSWWGLCYKYDSDDVYLSDILCADLANTLNTVGETFADIWESTDHNIYCADEDHDGDSYHLATGRYVNYITSGAGATVDTKLNIAKQAVKDLLAAVPDNAVKFGLMRFRGDTSVSGGDYRGGYLVAKIGTSDADLVPIVNGLTANGYTPLAETLAEAGLYFAGKTSWANTSGQTGYPSTTNGFGIDGVYTSPIEWRCQKNYIIVVTDGQPTKDEGTGNGTVIFGRADYINGESIGLYHATSPRDIDQDGIDGITEWKGSYWDCPSGKDCNHWLDDTAKFLYDVDLKNTTDKDNINGDSFNDPDFPIQNIVTYAIGFGSECDKNFLERVTNDSHGHGKTYMAEDGVQLKEALTGILGDIIKNNSNLVAPVVPVSKMNRIYSGNSLYISLFRPESGAVWKGNLKKFGFSDSGEILDKNGSVADFSATTKPSSCWSYSTNDGIEVNKGGAGEDLLHQSIRAFYTYDTNAATPPSTDLTASVNSFDVSNAALTANTLGLDATATATDITDLIHFIRADGDYLPITGIKKRDWILGDVLHSRPSVMRDGSKNVIFVGANDGFLHCFEDNEGASYEDLTDDDLTEKWCFVPWDLLPSLQLLQNSTSHHEYVDGSPVLYRAGNDQFLTFGLRRGGSKYYTLKVGAFDANDEYITGGYISPQWKWDIESNILGSPALGESWGEPRVCKLRTGSSTSTTALILAGGYDSENQDKTSPASTDSTGMAIFAIDASSGSLLSSVLRFTPTQLSSMTHSIVELISFDSNGDEYTDKIYAGDMGGHVFAYKANLTNGSWTGRKLFDAGDGTSATTQLKFFYAPDIAIQGYHFTVGESNIYNVYDYVFIGSGDREHPNNITFDNRFYGIKNKDDATVLDEDELADVTSYADYASTNTVNFLKSNDSLGWFIQLGYEMGAHTRPGEKVVSSPLVFDGIVYFTTFVPTVSSDSDMCAVSGIGEGFLYAVNYLTGEAIEEFNFFEGNDEVNAQGKKVVKLDERDRRKSLGGGIPTAPKLTVTKNGPVLVVGTRTFPVPFKSTVNEYFWRQQ